MSVVPNAIDIIDAIQLPTDQLLQLYEVVTHPPSLVFQSAQQSTLVKHHQVNEIVQLQRTYQAALKTKCRLLETRDQILEAIQHPTQHSKLPQLLSTYSTLNNQLMNLHQLVTPSSQQATTTSKWIQPMRQVATNILRCYFQYYLQYYTVCMLVYTFVMQLIHTKVDWILLPTQVRHICCILIGNFVLCSLFTWKVLSRRTPNKLHLFLTYYLSSSIGLLLYYDRQLMTDIFQKLSQYVSGCFVKSIFQAPLDDIYVLQAYFLFGVQVATWVSSLFLSSIVSTFIGFASSLYVIHYTSNTNPTFQACWLFLQSQVESTLFKVSTPQPTVAMIPFNLQWVPSWWYILSATPASIMQPITDQVLLHIETFTTGLSWYKLVQTAALLQYYYLQPITKLILQLATASWYLAAKMWQLYSKVVYEPMFMQDVTTEVETIRDIQHKLNEK